MNNLKVIDSSVLVSFFISTDLKHDESLAIVRKLFNDESGTHVIIPPLVLYETGVVATRLGYDANELSLRLYRLINLINVTLISLTELSVFKHLQLTNRPSQREPLLKTSDLLIAATALEFQAAIASFDQKMISCCQRLGVAAIT